jgi:hypothetical protein
MRSQLPLGEDAAMALGIASTAMPFARTPAEAAERWLRILRLHGEVGVALGALGVSEGPLPEAEENIDDERMSAYGIDFRDPISRVSERAVQVAGERDATEVATTDLLMAVIDVYGAHFDRVLRAHGTDRDELIEQLGEGAFGHLA